MKRFILLFVAAAFLLFAARIHAQYDPFNNTSAWSGAAEICHTVPGSSGNPAPLVYGIHVSNTSASTVFAAIFPNTTTQPTNGTVIPGGGWSVLATNDRDISTV